MATISTLRKRLEALDVMKVASDSVRETKEGITDAIIFQTNAGLRSDGSEILPFYTDYTIELKKQKGQPTDRVTLQDTSDYYRSIRTDVTGEGIISQSNDPIAEKINKKYATRRGRLLKPGGKYKQAYIDEDLTPAFMKNIKKATGLK